MKECQIHLMHFLPRLPFMGVLQLILFLMQVEILSVRFRLKLCLEFDFLLLVFCKLLHLEIEGFSSDFFLSPNRLFSLIPDTLLRFLLFLHLVFGSLTLQLVTVICNLLIRWNLCFQGLPFFNAILFDSLNFFCLGCGDILCLLCFFLPHHELQGFMGVGRLVDFSEGHSCSFQGCWVEDLLPFHAGTQLNYLAKINAWFSKHILCIIEAQR
jgi:hypothetical protein